MKEIFDAFNRIGDAFLVLHDLMLEQENWEELRAQLKLEGHEFGTIENALKALDIIYPYVKVEKDNSIKIGDNIISVSKEEKEVIEDLDYYENQRWKENSNECSNTNID